MPTTPTAIDSSITRHTTASEGEQPSEHKHVVHEMPRTEELQRLAVEMYARGFSMRDIEAAANKANQLAQQLTVAAPHLAAISNESTWIAESFKVAKTPTYAKPVGVGEGPYRLNAAYRAKARQLAKTRIALAGARLATVLNEALQ